MSLFCLLCCLSKHVPNAPCGVESSDFKHAQAYCLIFKVPNAPCGVESGLFVGLFAKLVDVPNAPCGVESNFALLCFPACQSCS